MQNVRCKMQSGKWFKNIKFLLYTLLFLIYNWVSVGDLNAHSFQPSARNAQFALPFPTRQVEKNIAVEFYYKSLPEDEEGYEKELSMFLASFKNQDESGLKDETKWIQDEQSMAGSKQGAEDAGRNAKSPLTPAESPLPLAESSLTPLQSPLTPLLQRGEGGILRGEEGVRHGEGGVARIPDREHVYVGQDVALVFKITDATMNWPIQGLLPDSPIRFVPGSGNLEGTRKEILRRARIFGGHFPMSEYTYMFILNSLDGTVSVMDTTDFVWRGRPIKIIPLSEDRECKGIDIDMEWLGRYAYVTLDSEEVVVIDCARLDVIRRIKAGRKPHHVFVQPDGKYAWVCNDGDDTVTVIDTGIQEVIKTITVGHGHHEMAFTPDSHYGCVTNQEDNSITIIDVYTLSPIGVVAVGKQPHGLGYSSLSQFMYVANEADGTLSVVDLEAKKVNKTIPVGKGVRKVRFGPDPRWAFAPNKDDNTCSMIDVTRDIVFETIKTGKGPEDVTFTPDWVFIRNTGSADMTAMSLERMEMLADIPIGYMKVNDVELPMGHVSMAPQGDGHSILVPSPAQRAVYRYMPGEGAGGTVPVDIYNTQANGSSKLVVYYRGLKEVSSGVFTRTVRLTRAGRYEIGFYVDNPELTACFELNVHPRF